MMRTLAWTAFKNKKDNPYTYLLYSHMPVTQAEVTEFSLLRLLFNKYDIWHIHWPEKVIGTNGGAMRWVRFIALCFACVVARTKRIKIVWTVHNIKCHNKQHHEFDKSLKRFLIRYLDGIVVLSHDSLQQAIEYFPGLSKIPSCITLHGHYRGVYQNKKTQNEARRIIGLDEKKEYLAFIGGIQQYKNVPALIRCFSKVEDETIGLIIAGKPESEDLKRKIEDEVKMKKAISVFLDYIADDSLQIYMNSASFIVLPYTEILNSGAAILALSFARPIVVPSMGSMLELKETVGPEWVFTYEGELDKNVLLQAMDWYRQNSNKHL